jgi:hypothetical protein
VDGEQGGTRRRTQWFRTHRRGLPEHGERGTESPELRARLGTESHDLAARFRLSAACAALIKEDVRGAADRIGKS